MSTHTAPPRHAIIEGHRVLVVEGRPPLPRTLDGLLALLFSVTERNDIRPTGAAFACEQLRTHRFATMRAGKAMCLDQVLRQLRVEMCRDCGGVCVRDVSLDLIPGAPIGRSGPRRRNEVIGWYSGARSSNRQYL